MIDTEKYQHARSLRSHANKLHILAQQVAGTPLSSTNRTDHTLTLYNSIIDEI
jgi:hypothetical protein